MIDSFKSGYPRSVYKACLKWWTKFITVSKRPHNTSVRNPHNIQSLPPRNPTWGLHWFLTKKWTPAAAGQSNPYKPKKYLNAQIVLKLTLAPLPNWIPPRFPHFWNSRQTFSHHYRGSFIYSEYLCGDVVVGGPWRLKLPKLGKQSVGDPYN